MITIRVLTACAACVALIGCGGPLERKTQYRAKAQEYIQAGNFPKARVALRNVLKIDPKDAEAYFLFAQVEEKEKNWRNAVANYQQVIELVPDHKDALITLAKYYLEARLSKEVTESADKVLAKYPQDPQAKALKIAVLAQENKVADAVARAQALSKIHPTEPDVAILLATLYSHQQRTQEATHILRRAIEAHPHNLDLLSNLRTVLADGHEVKGTEQVLRQMIAEEPTVFDHWLRLARFYDQQDAVADAETVLRDAATRFPDNDQPWLAMVDFLNLRKRPKEAETTLRIARERLPYSTKIAFAQAAFYERHNDEASARRIYEALVRDYDKKPPSLEAKVMIAQLDYAAGRQQEAELRLAEVLKENPRSADGLILQGKIALAKRNGKEAVQNFRTVLRDQPEQARIQSLLGQAHAITGEALLARESFERAISLHPGLIDSQFALAVLDSQNGQVQRARARLKEILIRRHDHFPSLEMLFALDLMAADWKQARATLAQLRSIVGEGAVVYMAEGKLYEAQRDFAKAEAAFDRASAISPEAPEPLLALIRLEIAQKQTDRARRRLETLLMMRPKNLYGHGLLGEVLALSGQQEQALAQFREATTVNPTWVTPWMAWANLLMMRNEPKEAIQILFKAVEANKTSEELHMLLASLLSNQGNIDAAIAAYETILRLNPRNVFSANNLASLLVDHKGDAASLEHAFTLSRDFEKEAPHPLFLDTLGWVRFKMGHADHALRLLKQAVVKAPDLPSLNYHLGFALFQSGQKAEAKPYLSKALKSADSFQGRREAEELLARASG